MKKFLVFVIISFFVPNIAHSTDYEEFCTEQSILAGHIMQARQNNIPIIDLKKTRNDKATNDNPVDEFVTSVTNAIIDAAYTFPRYSTEENQKNAIVDFQNMIYLECKKSLSK